MMRFELEMLDPAEHSEDDVAWTMFMMVPVYKKLSRTRYTGSWGALSALSPPSRAQRPIDEGAGAGLVARRGGVRQQSKQRMLVNLESSRAYSSMSIVSAIVPIWAVQCSFFSR